jgi:hypothetical protein
VEIVESVEKLLLCPSLAGEELNVVYKQQLR